MQEDRLSTHGVLILLLLALSVLVANGQDIPPSTVVALGVPAVVYASQGGHNSVCGIGYTEPERGPLSAYVQMVDLNNNEATILGGSWNRQRESLSSVVCPQGQVWFATNKAVWRIVDGSAVPFLNLGDSFGGFTYVDDARLIGNANRAVLLGQFLTPQGRHTLAFTLGENPQLIVDYGNNLVFSGCVTDQFLVTVAQFSTPFGKFTLITRAKDNLLTVLGYVPDLGNDGSQDTALRNLTNTVGCSPDTAGLMIRTGTTATAWTIRDNEAARKQIFSGSDAGEYPVSNIWGMTLSANGSVSFAMSVQVYLGMQAIFRIRNGKAEAAAVEGVDFTRKSPSTVNPFALGNRLLMFVTPTGGGYEIK